MERGLSGFYLISLLDLYLVYLYAVFSKLSHSLRPNTAMQPTPAVWPILVAGSMSSALPSAQARTRLSGAADGLSLGRY